MKYERKIRKFLAGSNGLALFEMSNGYCYVVDVNRDTVAVFREAGQYIRFNPYVYDDFKYEDGELERLAELARTLPAEKVSSSIKESSEDL